MRKYSLELDNFFVTPHNKSKLNSTLKYTRTELETFWWRDKIATNHQTARISMTILSLILISAVNIYLLTAFLSEVLVFKVCQIDDIDFKRAVSWPLSIGRVKKTKEIAGFIVACGTVATAVITIIVGFHWALGLI